MIKRGGSALLLALFCAFVVAGWAASAEPTAARLFQVRNRSLSEAAELVSSVLSPDGSVKLQPRQRTLVVEDRPEVLDRVKTLLESFDAPPRNVEITLSLLLGTDTREPGTSSRGLGPRAISSEVRGVSETLSDFTKWTSYDLLGSQSVTGVEGGAVSVRLSQDFRVRFQVESVEPPSPRAPQGMVVIRTLVLERISRTDAGEEKSDELYSTAIQLQVGKLLMVGAARSPESRRALFLTLKARAV